MEIISEPSSRVQPRWLHHRFLFSPTAFFSWALLASYNVVDYACVSILVTFYAKNPLKTHLDLAAIVICLQEGLVSFAAIVLARLTGERSCRRFYAIVVSTGSYITGIILLWSYARHKPQEKNMLLFLVVSFLFALGKGGADPLLKSFLEHNLCESYAGRTSLSREERKRAEIYQHVWFHSAWIVGATIAIFVFLGVSWSPQLFEVLLIVMISSGLLFLFGSNINPGPIGRSVDKDATSIPKQVRIVKWLFMFSCIACSLVLGTGSIFFQEQGDDKMEPLKINEKKVRFSFLIVIKTVVNEITILIFGLCGANKKQGVLLVRIGTGMVCAVICCMVAWKVEIERRKVVKENDPKTSVAWMCPHYVLLGLVEGLAQGGLEELFKNDDEIETLRNPGRLSKDMVSCVGKILGIPCILIVRRWFKNFDKDQSHLDRFYVMLAILASVFFCIYLCVAFVYAKVVPEDAEDEGS